MYCNHCGQPLNYANIHCGHCRGFVGSMPMQKQLVRPQQGRWIAGVSKALANYTGIDVAIIRLVWLALLLLPPPAIIFYVIAWIVIPSEKVYFYPPQPTAYTPAPAAPPQSA